MPGINSSPKIIWEGAFSMGRFSGSRIAAADMKGRDSYTHVWYL